MPTACHCRASRAEGSGEEEVVAPPFPMAEHASLRGLP
jgi:hypothetical protein